MLNVRIRNLVSQCNWRALTKTISERSDSIVSRTILPMGEAWTTSHNIGALPPMTRLISEPLKIALSECRLLYVDSHTDCRTITVSIATVDCDMDSNSQTQILNSGALL